MLNPYGSGRLHELDDLADDIVDVVECDVANGFTSTGFGATTDDFGTTADKTGFGAIDNAADDVDAVVDCAECDVLG